MTFEELLVQVTELLQHQGRISYGALKRRFGLDDAYLQDLKDELIDAQRVALDEGGKILVWAGAAQVGSAHPSTPRACYALCIRSITKRLSMTIAKARKCKPATVSGSRS